MPTVHSNGQAIPVSANTTGLPDTCKTLGPVAFGVPVPYPNLVMANKLDGQAAARKVSFMDVLPGPKRHSTLTAGDKAGTAGGIASGKAMSSGKMKSATAAVLMDAPRQYTAAMTSGQISVPSHVKPLPLP